jgi:hypothetical protein
MYRALFLVIVFSLVPLRECAQPWSFSLRHEVLDRVHQYQDQSKRLKLCTTFLRQRVAEIKDLSKNKKRPNRPEELRARFEEFTRLTYLTQDSLNSCDEMHVDIRKPVKDLISVSEDWQSILNQAEPDPGYDSSRKIAVEAAKSMREKLKELQKSQNEYFGDQRVKSGRDAINPDN